MNSSVETSTRFFVESNTNCEGTNHMSPVTDLALNLKSLTTTTLTGTPGRRISWSDPFPNHGSAVCVDEFSPSVDSPMLEELTLKSTEKTKLSRKILPLGNGEKDNVPFETIERSDVSACETDSVDISDSQDSGYSSSCGNPFGSVLLKEETETPQAGVSSAFTDITHEEFDGGLFLLDEDGDVDASSELNVKSLLTKPLCHIETPSTSIRKGKLPARRCLTLEMNNSESLPMELNLSAECNTEHRPTLYEVELEIARSQSFKRPDPCDTFTLQCKRRKSSPFESIFPDYSDIINYLRRKRSSSAPVDAIKQAVQLADLKPDLIGDCSRCFALPVIRGRHQDLKCISSQTLVQLLKGDFNHDIDSYTLVDCRYPYEYVAGHIIGAENIYTKEDIIQKFLKNAPEQSSGKHVIVFHCEFSSERAPNLCRFLRSRDRELNENCYPKLHHPEIYVLEGGYKAFFTDFKEYCEPQDYKPMTHKDHSSELRLFRAKSKSWGSDSKGWHKMKSSSFDKV